MNDTTATAASRAARQSALVIERPQATLVAVGPDRQSWLQGIVTCEVVSLEPGQGSWGLLLSKQGKIISDLNLVVGENAVYAGVDEAAGEVAQQMLDSLLIMEDADLERADGWRWLMLHGPRAAEWAAEVAAEHDGVAGRIDWTGLGGAALLVGEKAAEAARDALCKRGATLATSDDWQALRLERTLPAFGVDFTANDSPHAAGLERRAVNWDKGCYLGQEAVCMQEMRGKVKRRLVTLAIEGGAPPSPGTPVRAADAEVGQVTSAAQSPLAGGPLAIARVSAPHFEPGCALRVGGHAAKVVAQPF